MPSLARSWQPGTISKINVMKKEFDESWIQVLVTMFFHIPKSTETI
jgi:hypothetical protein